MSSDVNECVRRDGFAVVPDVLDERAASSFERSLEGVAFGEGVLRRGGVYAIRNLLEVVPAPREPRRRRVVHLEFAAAPLPCGLEWRS